MEIKRALVIPDCHIPFECKRSYQLMLDVAASVKIDEVVLLGDYADFYDISAHPKDPDITAKLIDEVDSVIHRLMELRLLFPTQKIVYLEGNHEYRLGRYIRDRAKEFFGIITVETMLSLEKFKIEFVPYSPVQKYRILGSKLHARHEPIGGGVHCANQTVVKASASVIFGHTHRIQESQIVSIDGENFRGISCGWLGDETHKAFEYVKNHHQWAKGFSITSVLPSGIWFNNLCHIIECPDGKYRTVYNGQIFEG